MGKSLQGSPNLLASYIEASTYVFREKSALFCNNIHYLENNTWWTWWWTHDVHFPAPYFYPLHSRGAGLVVSSVSSQHEHPGFESCSKIAMSWSQRLDPLLKKVTIPPAWFFSRYILWLSFFNLLSHSQWLVSLVLCFPQSCLVFLISL